MEQNLRISIDDEKAGGKVENSFTVYSDQPMHWQLTQMSLKTLAL